MSWRFIAFALLLVITSTASSQWYDPTTGERLPDSDWRKQDGELGAMLSVTAMADQFLEEWYSTRYEHIPNLTTSKHVVKGEVVDALVFFSGCGAAAESCDALVSFTVLAPDGSVYGAHSNIPAWPAGVPSPSGVALSQARLRVRIESKDLLGRYKVQATLHRPSTGQLLHLEDSFEVGE